MHRRHFEQFASFSSVKIHFSRTMFLDRIRNSYYDVPEGEAVCFFNTRGYLEIGIHGGNASDLLSLPEGKNIWIEFS